MDKLLITIFLIFVLSSGSFAFEIRFPLSSIPDTAPASDPNILPIYSSGSSSRSESKSNLEDSVTIKEIILPIKNEGYLSGQIARMFIEIRNNKMNKNDRDIKGLAVREIIDDELGVIPNSAKWIKSYSLDELCDLKSEIYRWPLDKYSLNNKQYSNCHNRLVEYNSFYYNNSTLNDTENMNSIFQSLYNLFDIKWIKKEDVRFNRSMNNEIWINNSKGDWVIIDNENTTARLKISDGRIYDLNARNENNTFYINDTNSIIGFRTDQLSPKESIIFYYDIKPKKTGIFNTETLIRVYDTDLSQIQDIIHSTKVEVKEAVPKFEIHPRPSNIEVYKYDDIIMSWIKPCYIDVVYDIMYVGGAAEPYCDNISIEFDEPSDNWFFVDEKENENASLFKRSNFKNYSYFYKYETRSLPIRIAFPNKGIYSIPGIWINGVHYTFNDQKITVDTLVLRHLNVIFLYIATISLIITAVELYTTKGEIKELAQVVQNPKISRRAGKKKSGFLLNFKSELILASLIIIITLVFIYLLLVN